jgi:eukaryotic-like serine/threonine-protein kinase
MSTHSPDRWARIDALFGKALDRPPSERLAFLAAECGDDQELFDAVRSLLDAEPAAGALIGESVAGFAPDLLARLAGEEEEEEVGGAGDADDDGLAGRLVGPYRLVSELGRGGMGAVYLAERADGEFEKRVALKLVKRGMDTDEVLRRFRFERRVLAGLEHPNIARLYDGGASEDGRPFLIMELVEGERITDYCDRRGLGVRQRIELFRAVGAAVQHAHQRLVVHRDIKPSNILVTADGTPKLLDFGIAKLLDDDGEDTPRTRTGVRMLTPEYAAPEQHRGEPVTTASDVFALGAVLYELLTGRRPFHGGRDRVGSPSSAVDEAAAAARGTTADRLRRQLRGDLDTVVLRALEPDPRLRYPSAQQLLEDLERHLDGRPVLARPPALGYRARKFVRRHGLVLAAAGLVMVSLLGGLGAALWQADRATEARARAEAALRVAEDERDTAEQVVGFMERMFGAANPFTAGPARMDTLRVGAFLERGAERIGEELHDRPLVRARMLGVLGRAYRGLGAFDRAESMLVESLTTYEAEHGHAHADVAGALNSLGIVYLDLERSADAEAAHRRALELRRELLGPDHPHMAASLNNLAAALQNQGRLDEAESLYDELLAIHRRMDPPDSAGYADALNTRMALAYRRDDLDTALPLAREILAIDRAMSGDAHPRVARSMNNLGQILIRTGDLVEAETMLRASLAMNRTILGDEHPTIATIASNLAAVLLRLDRHDEAEPLYAESVDMTRRLLGDAHPALAVQLSNYADLLANRPDRPDPAGAERLYREALAINRASHGPGHTNVGIVITRLGTLLCRQGRTDEGRELYGQGLTILRATLPEQHARRTGAEAGAAECGLT